MIAQAQGRFYTNVNLLPANRKEKISSGTEQNKAEAGGNISSQISKVKHI